MKSEIHRARRRRGSPLRWPPALLLAACGLGALAAPAAAQPVEPPRWLAESPGAGGAGFSLGLDFHFDDLDSLLNTSASTTVTLFDGAGGRFTQVIPGDPGLNNRKFDYRFKRRSWGAQGPIALPPVTLGGGMTLLPSLVVEAATTEVTFDFRDRTQPELSTSITGRGTALGVGLEGVALDSERRWFLGAGYRFRTLPDFELERSPPVDPLLDVVHDEVRLRQETHLATLRVGRVSANGRFAPYLGGRGRWTELEIDDELGFVSPLGPRTDLRSRFRFESDSALAVAGVDARLGGPFAGRVEVTYGDGDVATLLKVVYLLGGESGTPNRIARDIAHEFRRIEQEFSRAADEIAPLRAVSPAAYLARALELLDRTEKEAVRVLERFDFIALADWLRSRFSEARDALLRTDGSAQASFDSRGPIVVLAALRGPATASPGPGSAGEDDGIELAREALVLVSERAEEGCLKVYVRFTVKAVDLSRSRLNFVIHPASAPGRLSRRALEERRPPERAESDEIDLDLDLNLKIGSYTYWIEDKRGSTDPARIGSPCRGDAGPRICFQCLAKQAGPDADCPLDLVDPLVSRVECALVDRECKYIDFNPKCSGYAP